MGYIIGESTFPSTWFSMRTLVSGSPAPSPPAPPIPPVVIGDHNVEFPVTDAYLKTIEGNGFIRIANPATPENRFTFIPTDPPNPDFFTAVGFADPYPEQLVGRTVTTAGSTFTITADAFTGSQEAGSGGEPPISVEWFTAIT